MPARPERTARRLFLLGAVVVAFNLRPAIVSVAPLLGAIRADTGISYAVGGLLTTVPTLLMGGAAFLAPAVAHRTGRSRATLAAVAVLVVGLAVRLWSANVAVLLGSTLLVGTGIGVAQTYLPALVRAHYPDRAEIATGLYSTAIIVGAAVAAGLAVPVRNALGAWPLALAAWAVPAGVGLLAWAGFVVVERRGDDAGTGRERRADERAAAGRPRLARTNGGVGLPWRATTAWLTVLFFGGQSAIFYSVTTWLPTYYQDAGVGVGRSGVILLAMFAVMPVGSLALSHLADRFVDRRRPVLAGLGLVLVGLTAIAVAPLAQPFLWTLLLGLGLGGTFALALVLPIDHAATDDATERLTAMMLGLGYLVGAAGPVALGALLDALGNFAIGFAALAAVAVGMVAISLGLTRSRASAVR